MKMDIVFLGGVYPKHLEMEIIENSKGKLDFAANNLQWGIIDGLDICNHNPVNLCNLMLIGSFPKGYKKLIINTEKFSHQNGASDINIGFINIPGIKLFNRLFATIINLIRFSKGERINKVIVIYGIHTPFLLPAAIVKSLYTGIKLCLVTPDLPEFMSESKNPIYRMFKFVDKFVINLCLKKIDAFVLLTDFMSQKIKVNKKPWVRVEGIFNRNRYDFISYKDPDIIIMYSGNLDTEHGIMDLLNAFSMIKDKDFRLWITGNGNGINNIISTSNTDRRIKYWPALKQNELFKMQQNATLLVNPFKPDHRKTLYFFPSKTMEYMASGTPVLMYRLPCIPDEYHKYLFFLDDCTTEGMKNKILEICKKPRKELDAFGEKAQEFILNKKNPEVQCEKIFSMIKELFL
jgi:glycosyltransferase involved in cell wall biosynthesis